ncbi:MAG: cytidylate kinase family protein [Chloroflexota bacterium]
MTVIAIARQQASYGHSIGRMLADRLNYRFLDSSTVTGELERYGAAMNAHIPEMEEKKPSLLERIQEDRYRYRAVLRSTVYGFAESGNAVIVGLASTSLLRDVSHALKVLVLAPEPIRVERLRALQEESIGQRVDEEHILQSIRRSDRQRAGYMHYLFHVDWLDPVGHDLVINTQRTSAESAVELLTTLAQRPEYQPSIRSADRLESHALSSRLEALLASHPEMQVIRPTVRVTPSEVLITGEVLSGTDMTAAEDLVLNLVGNRRVINQLRMKPFAYADTM